MLSGIVWATSLISQERIIMNTRALKKQRGITLLSWLIIIAFVGFQAMILIKILPVYLTDSSIKSLWEGLESDTTLVGANPKAIRAVVYKRLKINNIYDMNKEDIKIKKAKGVYIVSLEYEPRGTIVGTLDYIMSFKHEAKIRSK